MVCSHFPLVVSLSLSNCFCQNIINHERTFNKDKDEEERSFEKSDFGERRRKANRFFCERTNRNGDDGSARKERLGEDVLTVGDLPDYMCSREIQTGGDSWTRLETSR